MLYENKLIQKNFWKKYKHKLLLDFKEDEIEVGYQKNLYNSLFLIVSLLLFIASLINVLVYFYYSALVQSNPSADFSSTNTSNSTTIINHNSTSKISFRIKSDQIDDTIAILGLGCSVTSFIIFTIVSVRKIDVFNLRKIGSFLLNFSLRLFFFTMNVWFSQLYDDDYGNHYIFVNIQSFFIHTYSLFIDPTYYLSLLVQIFNFIILYHYSPKTSTMQTSMGCFFNLIFYLFFFYVYEKKLRDSFYYTYLETKEKTTLRALMDKLHIGIVVFASPEKAIFANNFMNEKILVSLSEKQNKMTNIATLEKLKNNHDKRFYDYPEVNQAIHNEFFDDIEFIELKNENTDEEKPLNSDVNLSNLNLVASNCTLLSNIFSFIILHKELFSNFRLIGVKNIRDKTTGESKRIQILARFNIYEDTVELIYNDISLIQKAEECKAETKYKSLFLSKVAHEFKNPLISISELVNNIQDERDYSINEESLSKYSVDILKKHEGDLDSIKNLVEYMLILVKDFDLFSLKELKMKMEINILHVDLHNIVNFCLDIFKTRININSKLISLSSFIDPTLPRYILTDGIRIKQIIINLLSNSYKFTNNGEISLKLINEIENNERFIKIMVSDTGIGILKDELSRIAEPFSKLENKNNPHGAGLGLGIVKDMVNNIGKNFAIESVYGKGTSISFMIPLKECKLIEDEKKIERVRNKNNKLKHRRSHTTDDSTPNCNKTTNMDTILPKNFHEWVSLSLKKKEHEILEEKNESEVLLAINDTPNKRKFRILVVEDENLIRNSELKLIQKFFLEKGEFCELTSCQDGAECLNEIFQGILKGENYDAILSDESMSFIKGSSLCEIINTAVQDNLIRVIKLFIASSFDQNSVQFEKLKSNKCFVNHFNKPITKKDVENMYNELKSLGI